jgi:predicted DNA-binding transcriptional regulator AlpA
MSINHAAIGDLPLPIVDPTRVLPFSFLPLPEVFGKNGATALGTSAGYQAIADGLFVPPVKLGTKSVFPSHEVAAMLEARLRGASNDELRALVQGLVAQRGGTASGDQDEAAKQKIVRRLLEGKLKKRAAAAQRQEA